MIAPEKLQIALEALRWAEDDFEFYIKDKDSNESLTLDCSRLSEKTGKVRSLLENILVEEYETLEDMETV